MHPVAPAALPHPGATPATTARFGGTRKWLAGALTVLSLLAICGGGAFLASSDRSPLARITNRPAENPSPTPAVAINSRSTDPAPLTIEEVFPGRTLVIRPGSEGYQMVSAFSTRDCQRVGDGQLRDLLGRVGCNQVVQGTLRTADGRFLLNAGILNLADATVANQLYRDLKPLLDERHGRFKPARENADAPDVPATATRTGWHARGHFLIYCVLAKADGSALSDPDQTIRQMLSDLIESHLRKVVQKRADALAELEQVQPPR